MYCKICAEPVGNTDSLFEGMVVHPACAELAGTDRAALGYAASYPKDFMDYLQELLTCTDCPQETAAAKVLLRDFRDHWGGEKDFVDWIADN